MSDYATLTEMRESIRDGDAVLVNHPLFGSLWLTDVEVKGDEVEGWTEDRSVPSGRSAMHFPLTCVRKVSHATD